MNKALQHSLTLLPALFGGGYPLLVKSGHSLYASSAVSARAMIGIEAIYVLLCIAAMGWAATVGFWMVRQKKWSGFIAVVASICFCLFFLKLGFNSGAALLYAT